MPHRFHIYLWMFLLTGANTSLAGAAEVTLSNLNVCRDKVLQVKPGDIIKIELKIEDGERVYEFDIRDNDNRDWDLECHSVTAEIIEIEEEVFGASDKRFSKQMNVGLDEARRIALDRYPGEIIEVEYELEADGTAVYEFDISMEDGRLMKVEIDASSGLFHEETLEIWQSGYE